MTTSNRPAIVGIGGTNGSGKDTVARYLAENHGFYVVSATEMLAKELEKKSLPTDRIHKSDLSAKWRRQYGMAVIVDRAYEEFLRHGNNHTGFAVASLRHPAEAEKIHELGGTVLWVDAEPKLRYERIVENLESRGRKSEDRKTFDDFLSDEKREMYPDGDSATLSTAAVKEHADFILINDSDLESLQQEIDRALNLSK